ncbi:MAG TPA: 4Fe-4S binding protein [Deltaproteobacteria bacterium]|jgi:ferredoxin|nr:4Fe-4S binding protein [Deltaproteobacteria bacterium]HOI06873.1 4Fe-4S binding protein [Deltaproteobacteria bacterium]
MKRKIIEIDEELCNGCGSCITACAEGALKMVDGKAKLVSDVYCDGLGACLGDCPTGALKIVEREAPDFDEHEVEKHLARTRKQEMPLACGCPGSSAMTFTVDDAPSGPVQAKSALSHFPVKLQLLNPAAPFLKGADLLLMADCCALCYPALHQNLLRGKAVAMGCPKLDDLGAHIEKLVQVISLGQIRSLTVVHMEVPCCSGFIRAAQIAVEKADAHIPVRHITISRTGELLGEGPVAV